MRLCNSLIVTVSLLLILSSICQQRRPGKNKGKKPKPKPKPKPTGNGSDIGDATWDDILAWKISVMLKDMLDIKEDKCFGLNCTKSRTVGDKNYSLVGSYNTFPYGCSDGCVYKDTNKPCSKYCFQMGVLVYMFEELDCIDTRKPLPAKWNGVELLGGDSPWFGNVYSSNIPIRDCTWNTNAARVVCRDLGLGAPTEVYFGSRFGKAMKITNTSDSEHNWKLSAYCTGEEKSFNECKVTECKRETMAGVRCNRVRLGLKGNISIDDYPVAYHEFSYREAYFICAHMGYACGEVSPSNISWDNDFSKQPIRLSCPENIERKGSHLSKCTALPCPNCTTLVNVTCSGTRELKLVGGDGESFGNVFYKKGPVCDDGWDIKDAEVVCRSLGFEKALNATTHSFFGSYIGEYQADNVNCNGNEDNISKCINKNFTKLAHNCVLGEELAGVVCDFISHPKKPRKKRQVFALAELAGDLLPEILPEISGGASDAAEEEGAEAAEDVEGKEAEGKGGNDAMDTIQNLMGNMGGGGGNGGGGYAAQNYAPTQTNFNEGSNSVNMAGDDVDIKLRPSKGFLSNTGSFMPDGYDLTMHHSNPREKSEARNKNGGEAYHYPNGVGSILINGCYGSHYRKGDPCYSLKKTIDANKCLDMIESANFVGVGFDGTGPYTHSGRKKSLIQRLCSKKLSYEGDQVPDNMNVFGIYDTTCTGMSFQSLAERSAYQRKESDMGENQNLLTYHGSSSSIGGGFSLFGDSASANHASSNSHSDANNKETRNSTGSARSTQHSTNTRIYDFSCRIRRYNIFLDEVTPEQLTPSFLEDYMNLPDSYFDFKNKGPQKYNEFFHRWGTHYIRSANFGGKFTLLRESQMTGTESETEWQERVSQDTSNLFESSKSEEYSMQDNGFFGVHAGAGTNSDSGNHTDKAKHTAHDGDETNKMKSSSSFSMDDIIVEGGSQQVAAILADRYRFGFKGEFEEWLESIPNYPKGYDFKFGDLPELLDMDYRSLSTNQSKPCWDFHKLYNYDFFDQVEDGVTICRNCYTVTYKNKENNEVKETRKCPFKNSTDFQNKMDKKLNALKIAMNIFIKTQGRSLREISVPKGPFNCEKMESNYVPEITYHDMVNKGELYEIRFDLQSNIGNKIMANDVFLIRYVKKMARWEIKNPDKTTSAGLFSKKIEIDETDPIVNILGVQFRLEGSENGNFLIMNDTDCKANKDIFIKTFGHLKCEDEDIDWVDVPLAMVQSTNLNANDSFFPCSLDWSNNHMLLSESSCVRFTASSSGPIYFVLSAIPDKIDTWYYVRISPDYVSMYKGTKIMLNETNYYAALGPGNHNFFQTYIVCSDYSKTDGYTRIAYGKIDTGELIVKKPKYDIYLINTDGSSSFVKPSYFAFGSGEHTVQISDIQLLENPYREYQANHTEHVMPGVCKCNNSPYGCFLATNNLLTTVELLNKEFFISFEFKATKFSLTKTLQNVVHFTTGENCCTIGSRIPGVWIIGSKSIYVSFAVDGDGNNYDIIPFNLMENKWYKMEISQTLNSGNYTYRVKIEGNKVKEKINTKPEIFRDVSIYASEPIYPGLYGSIRNLFINSESSKEPYCTETVGNETGMSLLMPYIFAGVTVSIQGYNQKYLGILDGNPVLNQSLIATHINASEYGLKKWQFGKFIIEKVDDEHIYLRSPENDNKYLCPECPPESCFNTYYLTPSEPNNGENCKLKVFRKGRKLLFKSDYGYFLRLFETQIGYQPAINITTVAVINVPEFSCNTSCEFIVQAAVIAPDVHKLDQSNFTGSSTVPSPGEIRLEDTNFIVSKADFRRPMAVSAEMKANGFSQCIDMTLFASDNVKNSEISLEIGAWPSSNGSEWRFFPGDNRGKMGPVDVWRKVRLELNEESDVQFYIDGDLKYKTTSSKKKGKLRFLAGCIGMTIKNILIEGDWIIE